MMFPDEVTLAEVLRDAGYRTGIFGKWHLGDNFPMRAMDQGFQESLVHSGGGIGQPSDPPDNRYQDPMLQHNGAWDKHTGYCTDVFTDAAIEFIEANKDRPFYCHLATNAPHSPLEIDDVKVAPYLAMGLPERTAKVYAMIANVDENIGKVLATLHALKLDDNTIVIFMTDNGADARSDTRFSAGLRGQKGTVYQGGIRVPFFIRWPGKVAAGKDVGRLAAHIDVMPTLLDACGVVPPKGVHIDGESCLPLLLDQEVSLPDRTLFTQWHRGDEPEPYNNCAVRTQRYKLVNGVELYDFENDPGEQVDVAAAKPEVVAELRAKYDAWFLDVSGTRGYAPPRIHIGAGQANPVTLTRQDWRGVAGSSDENVGYWEVEVAAGGTYDVVLRMPPAPAPADVHFELGDVAAKQAIDRGATECQFERVRLERGPVRLRAWLTTGDTTLGARYVDVTRLR